MADFCRQCSLRIFGEDHQDFVNPALKPGMIARIMCEGCGTAVVDHVGSCMGSCLRSFSPQHSEER